MFVALPRSLRGLVTHERWILRCRLCISWWHFVSSVSSSSSFLRMRSWKCNLDSTQDFCKSSASLGKKNLIGRRMAGTVVAENATSLDTTATHEQASPPTYQDDSDGIGSMLRGLVSTKSMVLSPLLSPSGSTVVVAARLLPAACGNGADNKDLSDSTLRGVSSSPEWVEQTGADDQEPATSAPRMRPPSLLLSPTASVKVTTAIAVCERRRAAAPKATTPSELVAQEESFRTLAQRAVWADLRRGTYLVVIHDRRLRHCRTIMERKLLWLVYSQELWWRKGFELTQAVFHCEDDETCSRMAIRSTWMHQCDLLQKHNAEQWRFNDAFEWLEDKLVLERQCSRGRTDIEADEAIAIQWLVFDCIDGRHSLVSTALFAQLQDLGRAMALATQELEERERIATQEVTGALDVLNSGVERFLCGVASELTKQVRLSANRDFRAVGAALRIRRVCIGFVVRSRFAAAWRKDVRRRAVERLHTVGKGYFVRNYLWHQLPRLRRDTELRRRWHESRALEADRKRPSAETAV